MTFDNSQSPIEPGEEKKAFHNNGPDLLRQFILWLIAHLSPLVGNNLSYDKGLDEASDELDNRGLSPDDRTIAEYLMSTLDSESGGCPANAKWRRRSLSLLMRNAREIRIHRKVHELELSVLIQKASRACSIQFFTSVSFALRDRNLETETMDSIYERAVKVLRSNVREEFQIELDDCGVNRRAYKGNARSWYSAVESALIWVTEQELSWRA